LINLSFSFILKYTVSFYAFYGSVYICGNGKCVSKRSRKQLNLEYNGVFSSIPTIGPQLGKILVRVPNLSQPHQPKLPWRQLGLLLMKRFVSHERFYLFMQWRSLSAQISLNIWAKKGKKRNMSQGPCW